MSDVDSSNAWNHSARRHVKLKEPTYIITVNILDDFGRVNNRQYLVITHGNRHFLGAVFARDRRQRQWIDHDHAAEYVARYTHASGHVSTYHATQFRQLTPLTLGMDPEDEIDVWRPQ